MADLLPRDQLRPEPLDDRRLQFILTKVAVSGKTQLAAQPVQRLFIVPVFLLQSEKIFLVLCLRQTLGDAVPGYQEHVQFAHQQPESAAGDQIVFLLAAAARFGFVVLTLHIEGVQLAQLPRLHPGKVRLVAEHQVTAGNVPGVKLVIGDLAVPLRRRNERLHILPVLDFSGKEGKLMKQPVEMHFLVDMCLIGLFLDDIQLFLFHILIPSFPSIPAAFAHHPAADGSHFCPGA